MNKSTWRTSYGPGHSGGIDGGAAWRYLYWWKFIFDGSILYQAVGRLRHMLRFDLVGLGANAFFSQGREAAAPAPNQRGGETGLSGKEQAVVDALKETDRKVRAHEQAHISAGGVYVRGAASFGFTVGPDGRAYATSGEVSIDASPGNTPVETLEKARAIRAAALAPADPSRQDRAVAAQAARMEAEAAAQLATGQTGNAAPAGQTVEIESLVPPLGRNVDVQA